MHSFFNGFVIVYKDENDGQLPYIAHNMTTNIRSRWKASIADLFKNPTTVTEIGTSSCYAGNIPLIAHTYFLNGEQLSIEQVQQTYPEYFI